MTGFLYRVGRHSAERGWKVIGVWLLVAFVLMGANRAFGGESKDSFILKGTDSSVAQDLLNRAFPGSSAEAIPLVLFDPDLDLGGAGARSVDDIAEQLRAIPEVTSVSGPAERESLLSDDGHTAILSVVVD